MNLSQWVREKAHRGRAGWWWWCKQTDHQVTEVIMQQLSHPSAQTLQCSTPHPLPLSEARQSRRWPETRHQTEADQWLLLLLIHKGLAGIWKVSRPHRQTDQYNHHQGEGECRHCCDQRRETDRKEGRERGRQREKGGGGKEREREKWSGIMTWHGEVQRKRKRVPSFTQMLVWIKGFFEFWPLLSHFRHCQYHITAEGMGWAVERRQLRLQRGKDRGRENRERWMQREKIGCTERERERKTRSLWVSLRPPQCACDSEDSSRAGSASQSIHQTEPTGLLPPLSPLSPHSLWSSCPSQPSIASLQWSSLPAMQY